ncbi:MAG: DUF6111 family protein [Beijerinckiaceae bacterium]|jgi:hypothetical protein|nr:DUF6111 family protein [Beijerinckiaceae bacterium]
MTRIVFELTGFFLLPFLCYAGFLILQQRNPRAARKILTRRALQWQTLAGVALMALVLVVYGLTDESHTGAYSPAVFKDGQLVPGRVE